MQPLKEELIECLEFYAETWDEFEWSSHNEDNPEEPLATSDWSFEMLNTLSRLEEKFREFGERLNNGEQL